MTRARRLGLALALLTPPAGLALRSWSGAPEWLRHGSGGVAWVLAVYGIALILQPRRPVWIRAAAVGLLAAATEFSQLLHPPWLEALRGFRPVLLLIGHAFDARDFAVIAVGLLLAVGLEAGGMLCEARWRRL